MAGRGAKAVYVNRNGADLGFPDGTVIPNGGEATLSADALQNLGVQMWIEAGILVAKVQASPEPVADTEPTE